MRKNARHDPGQTSMAGHGETYVGIVVSPLHARNNCVEGPTTPRRKSSIAVLSPRLFSKRAHRRFRRWDFSFETRHFQRSRKVQTASCSFRVDRTRLLQVVGSQQLDMVQTAAGWCFHRSNLLESDTTPSVTTMTSLAEKADCELERLKSSRCDTGCWWESAPTG